MPIGMNLDSQTYFLTAAFLATGFLTGAFLATGFLTDAFLATGFLASILATGFGTGTSSSAGLCVPVSDPKHDSLIRLIAIPVMMVNAIIDSTVFSPKF